METRWLVNALNDIERRMSGDAELAALLEAARIACDAFEGVLADNHFALEGARLSWLAQARASDVATVLTEARRRQAQLAAARRLLDEAGLRAPALRAVTPVIEDLLGGWAAEGISPAELPASERAEAGLRQLRDEMCRLARVPAGQLPQAGPVIERLQLATHALGGALLVTLATRLPAGEPEQAAAAALLAALGRGLIELAVTPGA